MGKFDEIKDRSSEILAIFDEWFPKNSVSSNIDTHDVVASYGPGESYDSDGALISAISASEQGEKFRSLFINGDISPYKNDHSSADLALAAILAFWLGSDTQRIDRLFRQSKLMRDKWDSKRGTSTYGRQTIIKAVTGVEQQHQQRLLNDLGRLDAEASTTQASESDRFSLIPFADIQVTSDSDYLVKDLLLQGSLAMLYGPSNSGKTFVALDLALHLATNEDWHRYPTTQADVVYVAAEGAHGISKRIAAFKQFYDVIESAVPFYLLPTAVDLSGVSRDVDALIASIGKHRDTSKPLLVIVDTLARALAGADENSGSDISALLSQVTRLQEALGATVMLIHHTGKDESRGERGHSSLRAAVDTSIQVKVFKDKPNLVLATKQRDLDGQFSLPFKLVPVPIRLVGSDEIIHSCVVERTLDRVGPAPPLVTDPRYSGLSRSTLKALAAIEQFQSEKSGEGVIGEMQEAEVKDMLRSAGLCNSDLANSVTKAVNRAWQNLLDADLLSICDGRVFLEAGL